MSQNDMRAAIARWVAIEGEARDLVTSADQALSANSLPNRERRNLKDHADAVTAALNIEEPDTAWMRAATAPGVDPNLCDDEGCPHFGTSHVCLSRRQDNYPTRDRLAQIIGSFPLTTNDNDECPWMQTVKEAFEGGPEKQSQAVYQLVDDVLADFSLNAATAPGGADQCPYARNIHCSCIADGLPIGSCDGTAPGGAANDICGKCGGCGEDADRRPCDRCGGSGNAPTAAAGAVSVEGVERLRKLSEDYRLSNENRDALRSALRRIAAPQAKDGVREAARPTLNEYKIANCVYGVLSIDKLTDLLAERDAEIRALKSPANPEKPGQGEV